MQAGLCGIGIAAMQAVHEHAIKLVWGHLQSLPHFDAEEFLDALADCKPLPAVHAAVLACAGQTKTAAPPTQAATQSAQSPTQATTRAQAPPQTPVPSPAEAPHKPPCKSAAVQTEPPQTQIIANTAPATASRARKTKNGCCCWPCMHR